MTVVPSISPIKAAQLRRAGIKKPVRAAIAAKKADVKLSIVCAVLMRETAGGQNLWGHDNTIFIGGYDALHHKHYGPFVDEVGYTAYKAQRGPKGKGGMQGVGDMQLTYYSYQDEADAIGGCFKSLPNMIIGCQHLAANIKKYGEKAGIAAYNGTGSAAQEYATAVENLRKPFIKILGS